MNTVKNVEKAGRQFWLAGLGACIAGKELAVEKLDQVFETTNSLVNEMMNKGSSIEGTLKGKFQSNLAQDERIAEIRQKLGLNKEPRQDKIARLTAKVDALTDVVAKLTTKAEADKAAAKAPVAPKKEAAVKETVATESATKEAAKPAVKSATTKSTTTRKPRATAAKTTAAKSTAATKPATRRTRKPAQTTQSKTDTE